MSIIMIDQLVVEETKSLLVALLNKPKVLKEQILSDLPNDIVDSFIKTYCSGTGNKAIDIPTYFVFPNTPPKTAFLLVQYKGSEEDTDNATLGSLLGDWEDDTIGQQVHEKLPIHVSDSEKKAWIEPTKEVSKVISIPSTTKWKIEDNKIYLPYVPLYKDGVSKIEVFYNEKVDVKTKSTPYGLINKEGVTIDFISTNVNTIRVLTAIFTYIRIYLKSSLEENSRVFLPTIEMNGMDIIEATRDNTLDNQPLFYRRLQVTYKVDQTLDKIESGTLDKIIMNEEGEI